MPHSLYSLLVHIIFSTKDRAPALAPELSARLFAYMGGILRERNAAPLIINGPADHVHLLVAMPPDQSVAQLARISKANSSRWAPRTTSELPPAVAAVRACPLPECLSQLRTSAWVIPRFGVRSRLHSIATVCASGE